MQRERVVARAPVVADARQPVDDQGVDAELAQPRRDREPGLSCADDDDRRIAVGVSLLLAAAVEPILRAVIAHVLLDLRTLVGFFVPAQLLQIRHQHPGEQARWLLRIGDETQRCVRAAERGVEFDQRLDALRACARHPARRGSMRRNVKTVRLRARQRLAQTSLDLGASELRLDVPGEREHVAPHPVRQKQLCSGVCIATGERRLEAREPIGGLRRRVRLLSFGEVHHVSPRALAKTSFRR